MFELSEDVLARLRSHLAAVGYTVDGVRERLGPVAHAALHRNETTPGVRATDGGDPLDTLIRLWLLQRPVPADRAESALPGLLEPLVTAGLLGAAAGEAGGAGATGGQVRALVDVRPYGATGGPGLEQSAADQDWWVVADLTPGLDGARPAVTADHVLGVNSAASTLAQLTVRRPAGRALDLGTGCGVQALHLSGHVSQVVGTDVNPRALALARLTGALNGFDWDLREGSLFEPVRGETFDLVVSNPPFVISPRGGLTYRDSGLAGDEVCRRIVTQAPGFLADGGVCQILANWLHVRGEDWRDRLGDWLTDSGANSGAGADCDAWVVQREVSDPAEYVELWLKDAGVHGTPEYARRYEDWLAWFDAQDAEGVGFGWITLRRNAGSRPGGPATVLEEWPHPVEQPLGAEVGRWLDAVDRLDAYADDTALLGARLRVDPDVDQEQLGRPGAADPEHVVLRQRRGMRRAVAVDTAEGGFVGACDGELTVGQICDALATLLGEEPARMRGRLLPRARELYAEGYLHDAAPEAGSA
ncbi:class I SAM-dependent methyltransferase [Actinopolymorpha sp. NPDC004070]|uniref:class I SAM-dependent methyltransferase n=1 Tax=Actinopolymorpha sp. NPDC004070 TaxID=3154548 RepID=UPI00339DCA09